MVQEGVRHLFFNISLQRQKNNIDNDKTDMKKILFLIAAVGLLMGVISCGDDEPRRGVFIVNTPMVNHMVNTAGGEVMGISNTHNKLTIDTIKHTAMLELNYNDGSAKTLSLNDLTATPKRLGFYELKSPSYSQFSGYVDFNEGSMRYCYTTADGMRVISTIADVFFLKTQNTIEYLDTTPTTQMENTMYQFTFLPGSDRAVVKVMGILHAKEYKYFINMTATSVPYTITANGYTFDCVNVPNTATFRSWTDSVGVPTLKSSDKYPFKIFKATVDLEHDHLDAHFMMGDSATVTASGRTYPDYTAY